MNTDEVRKRFESWLINEQGYSKNDVARHNGARVYLVPQVHTMWLAYQQGIKDNDVSLELAFNQGYSDGLSDGDSVADSSASRGDWEKSDLYEALKEAN